MISGRNTLALAAALTALLAGCGNDKDAAGTSPVTIIGQAAKGVVAKANPKAEPPAPARSPEQMAAEALRVNPGPLVLVGFEQLGRNQVMAMTGDNGGMRTYMAPSKEAVILRQGMLVGTRGLGDDLASVSTQTDALIRAGRSGSGERVMRIYTGDGKERPLVFDCTTGPGPNPGVIVENCSGHGASFQNSFITQGGAITVSRQWGGPKLGYLTIQTLR